MQIMTIDKSGLRLTGKAQVQTVATQFCFGILVKASQFWYNNPIHCTDFLLFTSVAYG